MVVYYKYCTWISTTNYNSQNQLLVKSTNRKLEFRIE